MSPEDRLTRVFDRAMKKGVKSLSAAEQELYLIQYFILDFEMNDLSGYFYNRLPDLKTIEATITSMKRHDLTKLAQLLSEAMELFRDYKDPDPPIDWKKVLQKFDPKGRLDKISKKIAALGDYGLQDSKIK
jgi:hypothetical protein